VSVILTIDQMRAAAEHGYDNVQSLIEYEVVHGAQMHELLRWLVSETKEQPSNLTDQDIEFRKAVFFGVMCGCVSWAETVARCDVKKIMQHFLARPVKAKFEIDEHKSPSALQALNLPYLHKVTFQIYQMAAGPVPELPEIDVIIQVVNKLRVLVDLLDTLFQECRLAHFIQANLKLDLSSSILVSKLLHDGAFLFLLGDCQSKLSEKLAYEGLF
jgi:hypothetical protein